MPSPPAGPVKLVTLRRVVISLLVAGCFGMLVYAFTTSKDETVPAIRDAALVRVFPNDGDINVRQDSIGYELAFGFTGALLLDGVEIPDDQLDRISGINRISYTPAAEKETGSLAPGLRCATAVYWREAESRESSRRYRWCFTAA